MENISREDLPAEKRLVNMYQLLNINSELNKPNMTSLVPSLEPKTVKDANINHSNDNTFQNDNIYFESDEYDSDCSLGSLSSLYLKLKKDPEMLNSYTTDTVGTKQLQSTICKLSKAESSPGNNKVTETKTPEKIMAYDTAEDTSPIMKLSTKLFYGKQKSTSQHNFKQLPYEHSFKKKFSNSKILKTRSSVCTFKYNIKKLQIPSKKLKQRRRSTIQKTLATNSKFRKNKNLIRYQLKKAVPLLQFTAKLMKKNVQNNENTDENLLRNKIESKRHEHIVNKEDNESLEFSNLENQLYEPNCFFMNNLTDTGGTVEIANRVQRLHGDHYDNQDEIQDTFCKLFKNFNKSKQNNC